MTGIEFLLLFAVVALAGHVMVLQRHYTEKLADQASVIGFLLDIVAGKNPGSAELADIRDKIFNSSH